MEKSRLPGPPTGQVPERQVDRGQRLRQHGRLATAGQDVRDRGGVTVGFKDRAAVVERVGHGGRRDPVIGLERRRLAVSDLAV